MKKYSFFLSIIAAVSITLLLFIHRQAIASLLKEVGTKLIDKKKNGDESVDEAINLFLTIAKNWMTEGNKDKTEKDLVDIRNELEALRDELK